ncbi:MAG: rod shape-determining protein, partial [Acidimicrobiales bacterium]
MLRSGVAVDLGTVNTLVHVHRHGVVLDEPSAIARRRPSGEPAFVGRRADDLDGKEPPNLDVVRPLRDGVISDLDAASGMLRGFLHQARFHSSLLRSRAVICVPSGASVIERRALVAAAS